MLGADMTVTDRTPPQKFQPVDPQSKRQQYGVSAKAKFHRPFIAWDGEGYSDSDGKHYYMMLVASTGDYFLAPKGRSLSTEECFRLFLRVAAENPRCNHVIFGGGYDFNMILGDLPYNEAARLHRTGRVYHDSYRIEHRHRKSVSIRNRDSDEHVIIYDVWPFFQSSFVKTLDRWGIVPDIEAIAAGKAERSQFRYENHAQILTYCKAELRALVALIEAFREGLTEVGLVLNRWDGPGAVAGALYRKHGTTEHKRDMTGGLERVNRAAQRAYFGGRIEPIRFGNHEGPTWYYDVNSAYPHAISLLPSLTDCRWRHTKSDDPPVRPLSLYHVRWDLTAGQWQEFGQSHEEFYPLPFRRKDGTISFFPVGKGWYHSPEFELLRDFYPGKFEVIESYVFEQKSPQYPFRWVEDMYAQRLAWKQEGRGAEKILKLGLNSLYGKMVQQLGWQPDRGLPPYHQLEWGGFVTSFTRATLYRAARQLPSAVVGFETDGLITTDSLGLSTGPELGAWQAQRSRGVTYVQPGVYWLLGDSEWEPKHRGFDPGTLTRSAVLDAWSSGRSHVTAASTRFIGMGLAIESGQWAKWRRWETSDRELRLWPDNPKRHHPIRDCSGICRPMTGRGSRQKVPPPSEQLHLTEVSWNNPGYWTDEESEPYPLAWRDNPSGGYTIAQLLAERDALDSTIYREDVL